jgi:serine phosphatase RsbU (regulator of sigma subunit)
VGYAGLIHVSVSESRRYFRTQMEKATLENEMAAAREMQRVMVPADLPAVRDYAIESVYHPAAEVGGDFFQVIALRSGRTLIAIGDVSGKGLRAAMVVSMIVGMLDIVCAFTEQPAEIIAELNRRLCGRMHGGFATCLVLRLDDPGQITLANAGHLPPYLNGREIPFPGSIPLGLVGDADYPPTNIVVGVGDRVVLLTDGVPEAQNAQGDLFGFPQVEAVLAAGASAKTLADSAQQFGQNDDLTVISLIRQR